MIDLIYGALLGENAWDDFLAYLRMLLPNGQAVLFYHDASARHGGVNLRAGFDPAMIAEYERYFATVNPWMPGAATRPVGVVLAAEDMLPREELFRTEFYQEFLRPQDLETAIGVTLSREAERNFLLSVTGAGMSASQQHQAVATLQRLVPHLERAAGFYRRALQCEPFGSPTASAEGEDLAKIVVLAGTTAGRAAGMLLGAASARMLHADVRTASAPFSFRRATATASEVALAAIQEEMKAM